MVPLVAIGIVIGVAGAFWYLFGRVSMAFVVAPLAPVLIWMALLRGGGAIVTALLIYPFAWLVGMPLYVFLDYREKLSFWRFILASAFFGTCIGAAISYSASSHRVALPVVTVCGFHGAVTAIVFWIAAFVSVPSAKSRETREPDR